MREAGFKTVRLGYETSGSLQIRTGGKVFDADVVRAARILRKSGFTPREVQAYVMINGLHALNRAKSSNRGNRSIVAKQQCFAVLVGEWNGCSNSSTNKGHVAKVKKRLSI